MKLAVEEKIDEKKPRFSRWAVISRKQFIPTTSLTLKNIALFRKFANQWRAILTFVKQLYVYIYSASEIRQPAESMLYVVWVKQH